MALETRKHGTLADLKQLDVQYTPFSGVFGDRQAIEAAATQDARHLPVDMAVRAKAKRMRLMVFLHVFLVIIWALIAYKVFNQ